MGEEREIPTGWERVRLKELVDRISDGPFGSNLKTADYVDKGVRVIRLENIGYMEFRNEFQSFVTESKYETIQKHTVSKGDIILSSFVSENIRAAILPDFIDKAINKADCFLVRPSEDKVVNKYLFFYFSTREMYQQLINEIHGATRPRINTTQLKLCQIPLAPLHEQHRMVAKIEELFSSLDKGIESLKTAQQQLKVYRQAVLKWAFEGKLTNINVVDGKLPKGWKWVGLGEVCTNVEYGSAAKSKEKGQVPVLRMGNIQNGKFSWDDLVYTDDEIEIAKYLLRRNDVLFNRTNSPELVGKTAIYKGERPAIFAGYLIRINRIEKLVDAAYLTYYLNSHAAKKHGSSVKSFGVNQANINGTKLKAYPFPLPLLSEQQIIVAEIESRLSVCDKIEEIIEHSFKQAEFLRQSILKKAFEGKLVSQDPNDEPASVLLARIKAERERNESENPPHRQTRKTKTKKAAA